MTNFNINLNKVEATQMWNDIAKFLTIGITMHLLLYAIDDYGEIFSEITLKLLLYITIGLLMYHLSIKKLVDKYILKNDTQNNISKQIVGIKKNTINYQNKPQNKTGKKKKCKKNKNNI